MGRPFRIRLHVAGPVALGASAHAPCLDQVLAALHAAGTGPATPRGMGEWRPEVAVPGLDRRDGVCLASALWPVGQVVWGVRALARAASEDLLTTWARPAAWRFNAGGYVTRTTAVRWAYAEEWRWYGVGDADVVGQQLSDLISVGGHRGAGYGHVAGFEVGVIEEDVSVLLPAGGLRLMRPVPLRLVSRWSIPTDELVPGTFTIAYAPGGAGVPSWDPACQEPSLVPVLRAALGDGPA